MTIERLNWIFFNVFFALLPLISSIVIVKLAKIQTTWVEVVKDGQLFFFASTIAASSLEKMVFRTTPTISIEVALVLYALLTLLFASSGLFVLSSFLKLQNLSYFPNSLFSTGSTFCAILSVILGYIAFIQSGGK